MAIRSFLLNLFIVIFGLLSIAAGTFVLLTGVDLRSATGGETFVATWIPYLYVVLGLLVASLPFWRHWVR